MHEVELDGRVALWGVACGGWQERSWGLWLRGGGRWWEVRDIYRREMLHMFL